MNNKLMMVLSIALVAWLWLAPQCLFGATPLWEQVPYIWSNRTGHEQFLLVGVLALIHSLPVVTWLLRK